MNEQIKIKRNYRIDNVRALLIILVVVGHLTEIIHYQNSEFVYRWIYIFHMPGFALLSGLCWSGVKDGRVWKKLIYPYVIFQILYLIFQHVVLNGDFILQYTTPYWLMWYLLALIQWGMLVSTIPISKKNGGIIIICSFIIALLCGFDDTIGYYFSLSRTLVLFPFFLCGVWLREFPEFLIAEPKRWMRVLSGACVIGCTAIVWHYYGQIQNSWLYNSLSYHSAGYSVWIRLGILIMAMMLLICLFVLIPNMCIKGVSYLGQNTMPVFLLHGFIVKWMGMHGEFWNKPHCRAIVLLAVTVAILVVLTSPLIIKIMRLLMGWFYKKK